MPEAERASEADGPLRLHCETVGGGPAALLVHGLGDDSTVWAGLTEALAGEFACTTVDLPGHGRSPAPEEASAYERQAMLDALDLVLIRTGPAVLVGHSLGGYLGLAHHLARPSPTRPGLTRPGPTRPGLTRPGLTRPGALRGLVLVAAGPGFRSRKAMARWNDRVHANAPFLNIPLVAAATGLHHDSFVIDRLAEVSVPVGLVVGSDDRGYFGGNDYMERKLPDVRRRNVDGGRHRVMTTHPDEVADMVRLVAAAADFS